MAASVRGVVFVCCALSLAALGERSRFMAADDPPARRVTLKFGHQEPEPFNTHRWLFSPEIVADKDGTVRLAKSMLLTESAEGTDHHQVESLSDSVWVGKELGIFFLRAPVKAELYFYGTAAKVLVDGKELSGVEKLPSTGWMRVKLPPGTLKTDEEFRSADKKRTPDRRSLTTPFIRNHVILKGPGAISFVPRSTPRDWAVDFVTRDKGRTWTKDAFGKEARLEGECLIRLRLQRGFGSGWVLSPVFDLWAGDGVSPPSPSRLLRIPATGIRSEDPSTFFFISQFRTGRSVTPGDETWGPWREILQEYRPEGDHADHRWIQLRFQLSKTVRERPLPAAFHLEYELQPMAVSSADQLAITRPTGDRPPRLTSVPFVYQKPSPRLKQLREQYQLDKVIAAGKDEMEQLMLLRHWVRNQWHTAWGTHPAPWMPPWDALQILGCKDQPDCLTMCTHYACVFTQCCLALGWNARHCILDHHCTAEVWVDQHRKWVMMDAGNSATRPDCNLHFERNGVPLSALELHNAWREKKTEGIVVRFTPAKLMEAVRPMCRPQPPHPNPLPRSGGEGEKRLQPDSVPLAELKNYPVCGLENYRRYAFPARNNFLDSLYPGELYQGWAEYFYDGYWWVGDDRDDPQLSPEYSRHLPPSRPQDIDWDLNWTRIHLSRTAKPGELQVDLDTFTPNLERLERHTMNEPTPRWEPTPVSFTWKLQPGRNGLVTRSVNAWGRVGSEARVEVEWKPQKQP